MLEKNIAEFMVNEISFPVSVVRFMKRLTEVTVQVINLLDKKKIRRINI